MWRRANFLLPLLVCCSWTWAQTQPAPPVPPPVSSYQDKTYFLRSLCGDAKLDFDAEGKLKSPCHQPVPFTLDAIHISSLKFKKGKLTIQAEKTGIYLLPIKHGDSETTHELQTFSLKQGAILTIEDAGAKHEEDIQSAMQAVFAKTYADLAPNGPSLDEAYAKAPHTGPPFPVVYEGDIYSPGDGVSDPKLIYSIEPEFSEEGRAKRINGEVLIGCVVTPEGTPANVHVLRGIGYGMDEQAVAAVQKYRFKPAEKDGKPIAVRIAVSTKFFVK
jgi:TonB family protein